MRLVRLVWMIFHAVQCRQIAVQDEAPKRSSSSLTLKVVWNRQGTSSVCRAGQSRPDASRAYQTCRSGRVLRCPDPSKRQACANPGQPDLIGKYHSRLGFGLLTFGCRSRDALINSIKFSTILSRTTVLHFSPTRSSFSRCFLWHTAAKLS